MVSITLSVPEETKKLMREFDEMNWSGFVRKAIERKTQQLREMEALKQQFKREDALTEWSVALQRTGRKGRHSKVSKGTAQ